jgi:L-serine dehydratase
MISVFELFKVGVGPSSSHTVGPMIAAYRFAHEVTEQSEIARCCTRIRVELYGSLALTGLGHATDTAIFCGLAGCLPDRTEVDKLQRTVESLRTNQCIELAGKKSIPFDEKRDLIWLRNETLPAHPNAIQFSVLDTEPFPFTTAAELIQMARESNCRIDQIVDGNEQVHRSPDAIAEQLDRLWAVMAACIDRGCMNPGILPGSLHIRRRAPGIYQKLTGGTSLLPSQWLEQHAQEKLKDPLQQLDWVSLFALAVNEENAAGGQVVTAPTNGAAGVIPAVLGYYVYLVPDPGHPDFDRTISDREGVHRFLKTAGAIGMLYKRNASLSAAEMGCQGEVGVACSMAAAGLAACMGGTIEQIENAAEIGMEHNLGLTCDPIAGLVQVPCIERNTMGATKAINAARLAVLYGDGKHFVSLDRVIETMRQTGVDMQSKYKETSLGGLAVNVVDC